MIGTDLIVEARGYSGPAQRGDRSAGERRRNERLRVESDAVNNVAIVHPFADERQVERGSLTQRTAEGVTQLIQAKQRFLAGIGIARIPLVIRKVIAHIAMVFIRSGFVKISMRPKPSLSYSGENGF